MDRRGHAVVKESIEFLLVVGLMGLLFLLRLDAQRFGVAEYDDHDRDPSWRGWTRRLGWYGLGLGLVLLVYWLYPLPVTVLHLDMGPDRERALMYGLAAGIGGLLLAFLFAWFRYGGFRLPAPGAYPDAILNSVGTAVIDEALFRGVMLGLLLHAGVSTTLAIAIQAIAYGVATRLWTKGRSKGMLFIDLVIGLVGGWLVIETFGIGAAVVAHAITRFGVFLATGHSDQARPVGWEPEEVAGRALPPKGWDLVGDETGVQPWTAAPSSAAGLGPSYAGQSPFAPLGYGSMRGEPGSAPPAGTSGAPASGPIPDPEPPWRPAPAPAYWGPAAQQGSGPDPTSGPWVADPVTGAWSPAPPTPGEWSPAPPTPGEWSPPPPLPGEWSPAPPTPGEWSPAPPTPGEWSPPAQGSWPPYGPTPGQWQPAPEWQSPTPAGGPPPTSADGRPHG